MGFGYYAAKIALSFVLLPGVIVALFFLAALFARRFRGFFLTIAALFYLLSTQFVGNLLLAPLEKPWNHPLREAKVDAVIVLGSGHYKGSANLPLSQSGTKRLLYGLELAKKRNLPLIFSGAGEETLAAEATARELNENLGLDLKIATDQNLSRRFILYLEARALSTAQNAALAKTFFDRNGIEHPALYLVTSASHMYRAKRTFEKEGFTVVPAATDFRITDEFCYCFFFPSLDGLALNGTALYEYLALLKSQL